MKYAASFTLAGVLASAVTGVQATGTSPTKLQARATSASVTTLPTVTASGNAFWIGTTRFYINGVDYQPGGSSDVTDPLASEANCARDVPQFQNLGINTIRVYAVDNTADHTACMNMLAAAGIYVALDVNNPLYSLNRDDPAPSYNAVYLQSIFATMDVFSQYTNTLLFFSGNEVINMVNNTEAAPYVKAVTRDMRQYAISRGYPYIPIGYSAADVSNVYDLAIYMDCGNALERSDFFAFNDYQWCDQSSFVESGWQALVQNYSSYDKALFFSEYGCITNQRTFQETPYLFMEEMTSVFSGGLVYEYSEETNLYGLVNINGNSVSDYNGQFAALSSAIHNSVTTPSGNGGAKTTTGTAPSCPTSNVNWPVSMFTNSYLPAQPTGIAAYFTAGAGKGPGLSGDGSQNAGGAASGTASPVTGTYTQYATHSFGPTSTKSKGAAADLAVPPFSYGPLCTVIAVFMSSLLGAALL